MDRRLFYLAQLAHVLWLRATFVALAAVGAALLAHRLGDVIPQSAVRTVATDAAEELLKIMATSMLAVATFSLATLVAAASAVTASTTPRAAALVLENKGAQNALSSFVGAFIFSVVGLIAVGAGFYTDEARFVLFLMTLAVLAFVVIRLLRWIDQLSKLGRVSHVIDQVEKATERALSDREPFLGGRPGGKIPADALPVTAHEVGYVQHVDVAHLDMVARKHGLTVHLGVLPGAFVRLSRPVLHLEGAGKSLDPGLEKSLLAGVVVGGGRTFQQDPRFGLVALGEIAARALSPAVNDPGTAIDVVGTAVRILSQWGERHWEAEPTNRWPHVTVPGLSAADVFDDVFRPVERDGAGMIEVGAALQKAFADLALSEAPGFAEAARRHSRAALARAEQALTFKDDKAALTALAAEVPGSDGG